MNLKILTPELNVYTGEVDSVQLCGTDGQFEILNRHAPMIATLVEGKVSVKTGNQKQVFHLKSGIVEVLNNNVSVLTEGIIE